MKNLLIVCALGALVILTVSPMGGQPLRTTIDVMTAPPTEGGNDYYVGNRPPLLPSPFMKLPIGSITPKGWVRHELDLMRDGMTGHLPEISGFIGPNSGWWDFRSRGWEELPYWLKGYGDLGYVLKDERIIAEARTWLDRAIESQQEDGYFGPPENKANKDLWPNMVMLFALQSLYEATGDERVIPLMTGYFRYELNLPDEDLLPGSWQHIRGGDNLESIYWLYNRTGEAWLLEAAEKVFRNTAPWTERLPTPHVVNIAQCFRQPADHYQQTKDEKHLSATEARYAEVMDEYGQFPGGMFAADENFRPGKTGPEQAAETCAMVEFMYSFESLLKITGDPEYADRCEEVAFNSFPCSQTPDRKGLHYLTGANQVQLDKSGEHVYQNGGTLVSYSPWIYRCCQHNVAQGWPYYAEHLWLATAGNGLATALYAESEVTAKVGDGTEVTITEETDYPFSDRIDFAISTPKAVAFPLMLRVPAWCTAPELRLNGRARRVEAGPLSWITIRRTWRDGDRVRLTLPMEISVKVWEKQKGAVSVYRGPFAYSLKIGERWERYGQSEEWPEWEVFPTTPWNYGLIVDPEDPASSFEVVARKGPVADQPWTVDAAPIEIKAKGKRIPQWQLFRNCPGPLQESPVKSSEPTEDITLIPMGCARLRITVFPLIGEGPEAKEWAEA